MTSEILERAVRDDLLERTRPDFDVTDDDVRRRCEKLARWLVAKFREEER